MSSKFGELIKAGLRERGWSQAKLARQVGRPRSYIHYLVGEKNAFARKGRMSVSPDEVKRIAIALGVPINEALAAADWPPQPIGEPETIHAPSARPVTPVPNKNANPNDRHLYEIAHAAALEAIKRASSGTDSNTITIELDKGIRITVSGLPHDIAHKKIHSYKRALRDAYASVS